MLGTSLGSPVVKISPSIAGDSGLIPGQELRCQRVFQQKKKKKQSIKQKYYCIISIKASKIVHIKKIL